MTKQPITDYTIQTLTFADASVSSRGIMQDSTFQKVSNSDFLANSETFNRAIQNVFQFEAPGYKVYRTRRYGVQESPASLIVELEPTEVQGGRILLADGSAASSAVVRMARPDDSLIVDDADEFIGSSDPKLPVDINGRFTHATQTTRFVIVAASSDGYAEKYCQAGESPGDLTLQPWARVEGTLFQDGKPVPDASIMLRPIREPGRSNPHLQDNFQTRTDADGNFVLDHVPPVPSMVSTWLSSWEDFPVTSNQSIPLDLKPGETVSVKIGGDGLQIDGKVQLHGDTADKINLRYGIHTLVRIDGGQVAVPEHASDVADFHAGEQRMYEQKLGGPAGDIRGMEQHSVKLNPDGTMLINGVRPGSYRFLLKVYEPPSGCLVDPIGYGFLEFHTNDFQVSNNRLNLGTINIDLKPVPKVGDDMADFSWKDADGKSSRLNDFRGQFVLLDFWATWCAPCLKSMPQIQQLHEKTSETKKLVLVSLNIDEKPQTGMTYVQDNHLNWKHGFLGDIASTESGQILGVTSVPMYVLIDPAGKIAARSTSLEEVVKSHPQLFAKVAPQVPGDEMVAAIRYPHCVLETENLSQRSLVDAIVSFNQTSQESPTGVLQPPITEPETRDAITEFAAEKHVPEPVRVQLEEVLRSGTLPSNAYFRRFTRVDDGKQMQGVWWVRLVVETTDGPVYSVPVRTHSLDRHPYTQMERQQNTSENMTLLNRVSSYWVLPPSGAFPASIPKARDLQIEALLEKAKTAFKAKDAASLTGLYDWNNASESTRGFVTAELNRLLRGTVHDVWYSPREGYELTTWSAWQSYKPNLPVAGYLKVSYSPEVGKEHSSPDDHKILALELGIDGDELRLVNYIADGEANRPQSLNPGPSISGHLEPLADGTHLLTDVITNPGTLLSAHLANEEVRLRDFRQTEQTAAADEGSPNIELPKSDPAVSVNTDQQSPPQKTEPPSTITEAQRREIAMKAVADADRIPDEQARQKAQWDLVGSLVRAGLHVEAFEQAMKLRLASPQTCIYSLKAIAEDAIKRGDQATVQKAWDAANQSNKDSDAKYNQYVIQLGFKINRPVAEMLAVAAAAKQDDQQRAYRDIRNELAWRGRVDEAYAISAAHLPNLSKDFNDREIAFYCSSAKGYDYYLKHDHLGQAIRIIEQMPKGEHRDAAVGHLIDGLLYVANKDQVTEKNLALAETWVGRIDDKLKQAAARAQILQKRLPGMSVEQLEQQFSSVASREEKLEYLRRIFQKLLEENRIEEADRILPREVQLVKEQPRPEQKSKFGNVDDVLVEKMTTWNHHAAIVRALHKAGRTEEAKARLEAMKDLPDSEPVFLVGNLAGIRLQLYMELEDFDAVEKHYAANPNPLSSISLAAWVMNKGQFDRGWTHVAPLVNMAPETMFPPELRSKPMYFLAQPFENLAKELFKVNRPDDALTFLSKLPESRDTAHAFETFGELLVQSGRGAELDQWLAKLPHDTARTHTRLGALREIEKPSESPAQP